MPTSVVIGPDGVAREGSYSASRVTPAPSPQEQPARQPAQQPTPSPAGAPQDQRALVQVRGQGSNQVQVEGTPSAIREVIKEELEPELRETLDADQAHEEATREAAVAAALPDGHSEAWEKMIGNVTGALEGTSINAETLVSLISRGHGVPDGDMNVIAEKLGSMEAAQTMITNAVSLAGERVDAVLAAEGVSEDRVVEFQKYMATRRGDFTAALNELLFTNSGASIAAMARQFVGAGQKTQPTPVGQQSVSDSYTWPNGEVAHVKRGNYGQPDLVIMNGMEVTVDVAMKSYGLLPS